MKQKGNISIVLLCGLIVMLTGAAITMQAVNSKYEARTSYERIENRYIAESGIDMAAGLFQNYLSNQKYILTYTKNEDGSCSLIDAYSPFLIDEIKESDNTDIVSIDLVSTESADYLSSIGFLDFIRGSGIEVSINTFHQKENFKLSRLCVEPNFIVSASYENTSIFHVKSKINPIYLTLKSRYKGGEVLCNVEISNIYVVREPFKEINVGEIASVEAHIDIINAKVNYENYQNYRVKGGV